MNGNEAKVHVGRRSAVGLALAGPAAAVIALAGGVAQARPATTAGKVKVVNVVALLGAHVADVRRRDSGVPVLLPGTLRLPEARYAAGTAGPGRYRLELDYAEPCGGANVCMAMEFLGQRGNASPHGRTPVPLAGGITGAYSGIQCAASCSPAAIEWREHGVLYTLAGTLAIELAPKAKPAVVKDAFVSAADQAISAGPR